MLDLSIVIPVFNRSHMLIRRLEELERIAKKVGVVMELIIVDDCSTEEIPSNL